MWLHEPNTTKEDCKIIMNIPDCLYKYLRLKVAKKYA